MALSTKDFATLVQDQVIAIQAKLSTLLDFTTGSVLRAITEANAAVGIWVESLIVQLLATTRASTSVGGDLDTWVADYGLARLAATSATGSVTFSRFTATVQAIVPIGTVVQTVDGTERYVVVADTLNPAYSAMDNGYVLPMGTTSATATAVAAIPGSGGNVGSGTVISLVGIIPYIDTVTNLSPFANGSDAETDAQLRARFVGYINSLSKATIQAVQFAVTSVRLGTTCYIVENANYDGSPNYGYFYVVVDDGTGYPNAAFIAAVVSAVDSVRPVTSRFGVFGPTIVNANIVATITVAAGYDSVQVKTLVTNAIRNYINVLTFGQDFEYTRIATLAYAASPGVANVTAVTLNGGTSDLAATNQQLIKANTVTIN